MEAVYLVGSITSTIVTSSLLSLSLAVRSLLSLALASPARNTGGGEPSTNGGDDGDVPAVRLYEGRVRHARRRPIPHAFDYPVRYALIDLDRASPQLRLSHLSADRAREVAATNGPVLLLTIPASVGYEQNPLSVYYCYDVAGEQEQEGGGSSPRLKMCIAEVTNTPWGERVLFVFSPGSDLVAKPLHVSPFMDMLGNWSIHADEPGEDLSVAISVEHPTLGNYFTATLHAKQVYSSSSSLNLATFFWMMPHKVAIWIYWQTHSYFACPFQTSVGPTDILTKALSSAQFYYLLSKMSIHSIYICWHDIGTADTSLAGLLKHDKMIKAEADTPLATTSRISH